MADLRPNSLKIRKVRKNMVTKFFQNSNFSDFLGIRSEISQSCSMILKRIVQDFATEMKFGLENLQTKIKDLSTALKTRLELNKEDVIQAGYPYFSEFVKLGRQRVRLEFE